MAIYVDMYGNEYVKDGNQYLNLATRKHERIYSLLVALWGNNVNGYNVNLSYYRPAGGTYCSDEEVCEWRTCYFHTREAAKNAAIQCAKDHYRALAILS